MAGVYLQGSFTVTKAVLSWETAYGKVYEILGNAERKTWTILASVNNSGGGIYEAPLSSKVSVKLMKLHAITRYRVGVFTMGALYHWGEGEAGIAD